MTTRLLIMLLFTLPVFAGSYAQQTTIGGKIYESVFDSTLESVNVFNTTKRTGTRSARDGSYQLAANEGDIVSFSRTGYITESITVTFAMLLIPHDVTMKTRSGELGNVTLRSGYQYDSLSRRNEYRNIYDSLTGITGRNRPTDGFGISISPLSYFSKRAKQQRSLKKRLVNDEREAYIDHSFPVEWVERMTGLHNDSLRLFMYRYRPSYDFCRDTDRAGMLIYMNDKLIEFKKSPATKKEHE